MKRIIAWIYVLFGIHLIPKDVKIKAYKQALDVFRDNKTPYGLCYCLCYEVGDDFIEKQCYDLKYRYFPELFIQKPWFISSYGYWWDSGIKEPRIKVLNKAIKRLES